MRILTKAQVLMLHEQLVNETGGSLGLRDEGMLESALDSPFQEFATFSPYPTIQQKAARLGFCLVMNHPFRAVFKEIFRASGHLAHYNMMMRIGGER